MKLVDEVRELKSVDLTVAPVGECRIEVAERLTEFPRMRFARELAKDLLLGLRELSHFALPNGWALSCAKQR
jgi:hypothetical protein